MYLNETEKNDLLQRKTHMSFWLIKMEDPLPPERGTHTRLWGEESAAEVARLPVAGLMTGTELRPWTVEVFIN